ncbi:MAG: YggS family pyridoxal phosphate-dependent enzyme [Hyphomicrobiales bacterium]
MSEAVSRRKQVCAAIEDAERVASRPLGEVTLVAVSKTYDAEAIWPVIEAGQRVFGENRVQEAMGKWPALRERLAASGNDTLELHLIGPLQSNKAKEAVATFDVIESVDRDKIASALAKEMKKQNRHLPCTVQVNTGMEPQKAGIAPAETANFVARCREVHGLTVQGLMCIPPVADDPAKHFALLANLADETGLPIRSMGMSGDYQIAIAHGATHVRVGSAIFGPRGT